MSGLWFISQLHCVLLSNALYTGKEQCRNFQDGCGLCQPCVVLGTINIPPRIDYANNKLCCSPLHFRRRRMGRQSKGRQYACTNTEPPPQPHFVKDQPNCLATMSMFQVCTLPMPLSDIVCALHINPTMSSLRRDFSMGSQVTNIPHPLSK